MKCYKIRSVTFKTGERFVNLFGPSGEPMFWPTIWTHSKFRTTNKSVNTTISALRAVQGLYEYLDSAQIDLDTRLKDGWLLSLGEMDGLIRYLGLAKSKDKPQGNVVELKKWVSAKGAPRHIGSGTHAIRINYVREYLAYRCLEARIKLPDSNPIRVHPGIWLNI